MASESEQDRRETSADIADEIRRAVESMGDEMPYTVSAGTMRMVADRIEAAWKRQEKTYLDQIRDAMNMWGREKHIAEHAQKPTVGNAAAMREALVELTEKVLDYLQKGLIQLPLPIEEANAKARSALSAPARQCDVGTAEEQFKRYLAFCHSESRGCKHCRANMTRLRGTSNCDLAWAQTPYEAEEGGAA